MKNLVNIINILFGDQVNQELSKDCNDNILYANFLAGDKTVSMGYVLANKSLTPPFQFVTATACTEGVWRVSGAYSEYETLPLSFRGDVELVNPDNSPRVDPAFFYLVPVV